MTAQPRVLYITDDRETYSRGNYYLSYQRAFARNCQVTLAHPLEPMPAPGGFDAVVLGHAAIEHYVRMRGRRYLPSPLRPILWLRHAGLRALRDSKTPTVLITKNDYKHFEVKNSFISFVRPRLVVTQHKSALEHLAKPAGVKMIWLPFGVDAEMFTPPNGTSRSTRPFTVGFLANANSAWNDGERERYFKALQRLEPRHAVSLTITTRGKGFLVGNDYVDWIRSCAILGNTVSAVGTVGPRFLEAMACDSTPMAPRNPYEGLLEPDLHYVPIDEGPGRDYPGLEAAVDRYLSDATYRQRLVHHGRALVAEHTVDRHVIHVLREIGV